MPQFKGTITTPHGKAIAVEGVYIVTRGEGWDGAFKLTPELPRGEYDLKLSDGRAVRIQIVHTSGEHHGFQTMT